MFGGLSSGGRVSRVTGLFGARDHDNFLDGEEEDGGQQQPNAWEAPMGAVNSGKATQANPNGMSDELAKIKAELDAAVIKEKPPLAELKQSPRLKALEPPAAAANFPSAGAPFPREKAMSPRLPGGEGRGRAATDQRDASPGHRASSRSAKKSHRKKSFDEGDGAFGEFPPREAFGAFPAPSAKAFVSSPVPAGFGDFSGGWPDAARTQSSTTSGPETLDPIVTSKSAGSPSEDAEKVAAASGVPSATPGAFDEAILAALAALPQNSLVDVLRRLAVQRPNEVALALGPATSDRGGATLQRPQSEAMTAAASSPPVGFASPMPDEARSPMPATEARSPNQIEGSAWKPQQSGNGLFRMTSAPAPQTSWVTSGPGGAGTGGAGPWGNPVQAASATLGSGGLWAASATEPPLKVEGSAPPPPVQSAGRAWPSSGASPWG
mmetsp:Transcript_21924/g.51251  ORF Transcript_21924/g.51251 Transcript_21924/m.51251 type:complete len:437 (-) Transcript_21924:115-1425(-)